MATFTKNKETGNFDVIGTPDEVVEGQRCKVTKKSGETTEVAIGRTTKPFKTKFGPLEGKEVVIGKVAPSCVVCGIVQTLDRKGYPNVRIYRSGECQDCYEERKMGY